MSGTRVRVLAFARIAEILGTRDRVLDLPDTASVADAWKALASAAPDLAPLESATRFARNGTIVGSGTPLSDGDELALLPPVGGG